MKSRLIYSNDIKSFTARKLYIKLMSCEDYIFPQPEIEFRFHPTRKWRFDFAWPDKMIAVEFEGGIFKGFGHTRGIAYTLNCEKYNESILLGWKLYRFTVKHLENRYAMNFLKRAFINNENLST